MLAGEDLSGVCRRLSSKIPSSKARTAAILPLEMGELPREEGPSSRPSSRSRQETPEIEDREAGGVLVLLALWRASSSDPSWLAWAAGDTMNLCHKLKLLHKKTKLIHKLTVSSKESVSLKITIQTL